MRGKGLPGLKKVSAREYEKSDAREKTMDYQIGIVIRQKME